MGERFRSRFRTLIRDTLIVGGVTLVLLMAIELGLRLFWPQITSYELPDGITLGTPDNVLIYTYNPGVRVIESGPEYRVEYRINEDGHRDETPHPVPKPEGTTRILLVGDSFTFGEGVSYEDSWPVLLERGLIETGHQVDVVKAGIQGFDTRTEVLYLERIFDRYDPDLVVLVYLPNDLFSIRPIADQATRDSLANAQQREETVRRGKVSSLHVVTLAERIALSNEQLYTKLYMLRPWKQFFEVPITPVMEEKVSLVGGLLARARAFCDERDARFMVLSLPQQFQVFVAADDHGLEGIDPALSDHLLQPVADADGFPWFAILDPMAESYRASGEDLFLRHNGHLNPSGNRFVAEYFTGVLLESAGDWASPPSNPE